MVIEKTFDPSKNLTRETHRRKDGKQFGMADSVKGFGDVYINNMYEFTIIKRSKPMAGLGKIDCNRYRYSLLFVHRMHWSLYFFE